ncbi:MAG TPA: HAMP domain-containing protein, partial [Polyangiaceae bacterium]|nr:HAMP domain-containing protein [Polyangiaceae bacterium]
MPRYSIQRKLIAGFGFLLLLVLAVAATGLLGLHSVQHFYQSAIEHGLEKERLAEEMSTSLMEARRAEKEFLLGWQVVGFQEAYGKHIGEYQNSLSRMRSVMQELEPKGRVRDGELPDQHIADDLRMLKPHLDAYERDFLALVSFIGQHADTNGDDARFRSVLANRVLDVHAAATLVRPVVHDIALSGRRYAEAELGAAKSASRNTVLFVAMCFVAALLIGLSTALVLSRRIKDPIQSLARAAQAVGAGDLEAQVRVTSNDELGTLASVFNTMTDRLRGLVASLELRVRERKEVEDALRQSRELLQSIIDNSLAIIYVKDLRGRFMLV